MDQVALGELLMSRSAVRVRAWAVGSAAMCVVVLAGCSSEEPVALPSATTVSVATTTESAEDLAFKEAEAAYRAHIALLNELAGSPGDKQLLAGLAHTSTGVERATQKRWYGDVWIQRKWRLVRGKIVVRNIEIVKKQLALDPRQFTFRTCDDASGAIVVDVDGKRVRKPGSPAMADTEVIVIEGADGVWRVSNTVKSKLVEEC